MDDKKLIALARRNAAKSQAPTKPRRAYDATLNGTRHADQGAAGEADRLFKEMKRREF